MLWLIRNTDTSDVIVGCNICTSIKDSNMHQLWATRPNGKTMIVKESNDKQEVELIKNAIDYAIEHKETSLRLD